MKTIGIVTTFILIIFIIYVTNCWCELFGCVHFWKYISCTPTKFHYLLNLTLFTDQENAFNLICVQYQYKSIAISVANVNLIMH